MKVWAFANQKGGVGKTTTTITLAGLIAQQSKRVLMIDFDPHSSLTAYLGWDADTLDSSSYLLFDALSKNSLDYRICQRILMRTPFKNLYLIPGSLALATLDKKLSKLDGMGLVLEKTLELLKNDFDYVLIDCPPVVGILMVNALATCHHLIIPVQTEYLALKGLERMMRTIEMIAKAKHQKFSFTILPTMFDKRTNASLNALSALQKSYPKNIWVDAIPIDTKLRDASRVHKPPSYYDIKTRSVEIYKKLLLYLMDEKTHEGCNSFFETSEEFS